jgi:hypothetical protein
VIWWPFGRKGAGGGASKPSPRRAHVPKIFICYRRDDSQAAAGRLFDRLSIRSGGQNIFMDIDRIAPGENFVESIMQ